MTAIKLAPCPICGRTDGIVVEKSMYSREGKEIRDVEKRKLWIVKCEHDYAITEVSHSRIHAISRWNRGELNPMCETLEGEYTNDIERWLDLRNKIVEAQVEDLKMDAKSRELNGMRRGKLKGEDWFKSPGYTRLTNIPGDAIIRAVKQQAPYDVWRDRHGCISCHKDCPHATKYLWMEFRDGTAPECISGDEIPRNKDGTFNWQSYLSDNKRKRY